MSTERSLVRNSVVLLTGTFVSKALVFVSYLVLTRVLGAEGFGHYVYVFTALAFFELFADAGLDPLLVREGARRPDDLRRTLGDAILLRTILTVLAAGLACVLVPRFSGRPGDGALVLLASASLLATNRRPSLRSLLEVPARIRLRMGLPTALGALAEIGALALLVVLAPYAGLPGAIAAQPLAQIPIALLFLFLLAPGDRPLLFPDFTRLLSLLRRTFPLLGALALNIVLARADVLFLERLRGSREVGIYAAPVRLVEIANLLPALLLTSVYPLLVTAFDRDRAEAGRLYRATLRLLTNALTPFVVALVLFSAPIIEALFGAEFSDASTVLPWLAAAELLIFIDIMLGARLLAEHEERRNTSMLVGAAAFHLAANAALVPAWGARGAAFATIGSYAVRAATGLFLAPTREAVVDAMRAVRAPWIAGALALGAGLAARSFAGDGVGSAVFVALAAALVYPLALLRLGGFPEEDRELIRRAFSSART